MNVVDITTLRPSWVRKIEITRVEGVTVPGDCWLWTGSRDKKSGYGRVCVPNQKRCGYMHRVVYEILVGPIADGLQLDHLCRQRACCAPYHLEPVTCAVNVGRGIKASQTHCERGGHPLSGDNLYLSVDKQTGYQRRVCRTCRDEKVARWRAERKLRQDSTWAKYLSEEDAA